MWKKISLAKVITFRIIHSEYREEKDLHQLPELANEKQILT
jgi:hypothetical protein